MLHIIENTEPVGIVISPGKLPAPATALLAYEWGPAPEQDIQSGRVATRAA